jgi:hypothetical protein
MTTEHHSMKIRIHAEHLRKRLLSKNPGEMFRDILSRLTDEELVLKYEEHHTRQLNYVRERSTNA